MSFEKAPTNKPVVWPHCRLFKKKKINSWRTLCHLGDDLATRLMTNQHLSTTKQPNRVRVCIKMRNENCCDVPPAPFQKARPPSSAQILRAASMTPVYVVWPLRATTWNESKTHIHKKWQSHERNKRQNWHIAINKEAIQRKVATGEWASPWKKSIDTTENEADSQKWNEHVEGGDL